MTSKKYPAYYRTLTRHEIALAETVFQRSIAYSRVKIHNHGTPWLLGLQDKNTAVVPNGEIYFHASRFKEDFTQMNDVGDMHWLIHELVHVWQYQLGFRLKWNAIKLFLMRVNDPYTYDICRHADISDYGFEQQADIIADYAMYINGYTLSCCQQYEERRLPYLPNFAKRYQQLCEVSAAHAYLPYHRRVLERFLMNPQNSNLLPRVLMG